MRVYGKYRTFKRQRLSITPSNFTSLIPWFMWDQRLVHITVEWLESFRVVAKKKKKKCSARCDSAACISWFSHGKDDCFPSELSETAGKFWDQAFVVQANAKLYPSRMYRDRRMHCSSSFCKKKKQFFQATNGQLQENKVCYLLRKTVLKVQVKYINIHIYIVILDFFFDNEQLQQLGKLRECCFCWFLFW